MRLFHIALALALVTCCYALAEPIDKKATAETKALFQGLLEVARDPEKIIFGHHRATWNGIYGQRPPYPEQRQPGSWHYSEEMAWNHTPAELCDLKALTGDYPGLIGANLMDLQQWVLDVALELTRQAYDMGIVNTYHMAMRSPVTNVKGDGGEASLVNKSIVRILPNGTHHSKYLSILDRLAEFAHNITDADGKLIPIVFRPFHENNGKGPWYGLFHAANNEIQEFISLWQFTVKYLRDTKEVHNFLYAFAPSCRYTDFYTDKEFKGRKQIAAYSKVYPGDEFVDIMAFDCYGLVKYEDTLSEYAEHVRELVVEAEAREKIPAIAAIGLSPISSEGIAIHPDFWMKRVLAPLKNSTVTTRIAYIMAFANRWTTGPPQAWVPYPGHVAAEHFMEFYNDSKILFRNDLPDLYS